MNLTKLQEWLQSSDNDVAYISNPTTIAYFTGYDMNTYILLINYTATSYYLLF